MELSEGKRQAKEVEFGYKGSRRNTAIIFKPHLDAKARKVRTRRKDIRGVLV